MSQNMQGVGMTESYFRLSTCPMANPDQIFLTVLRKLVKQHGSQSACADRLGVNQQYLSDLIHVRRTFSEAMAAKLGYKRGWIKL